MKTFLFKGQDYYCTGMCKRNTANSRLVDTCCYEHELMSRQTRSTENNYNYYVSITDIAKIK